MIIALITTTLGCASIFGIYRAGSTVLTKHYGRTIGSWGGPLLLTTTLILGIAAVRIGTQPKMITAFRVFKSGGLGAQQGIRQGDTITKLDDLDLAVSSKFAAKQAFLKILMPSERTQKETIISFTTQQGEQKKAVFPAETDKFGFSYSPVEVAVPGKTVYNSPLAALCSGIEEVLSQIAFALKATYGIIIGTLPPSRIGGWVAGIDRMFEGAVKSNWKTFLQSMFGLSCALIAICLFFPCWPLPGFYLLVALIERIRPLGTQTRKKIACISSWGLALFLLVLAYTDVLRIVGY